MRVSRSASPRWLPNHTAAFYGRSQAGIRGRGEETFPIGIRSANVPNRNERDRWRSAQGHGVTWMTVRQTDPSGREVTFAASPARSGCGARSCSSASNLTAWQMTGRMRACPRCAFTDFVSLSPPGSRGPVHLSLAAARSSWTLGHPVAVHPFRSRPARQIARLPKIYHPIPNDIQSYA